MSSAVVSTSAALGRPFLFDAKAVPEVSLPSQPSKGHPRARPPQPIHPTDFSADLASSDPRLAHLTPASRLDIRPAPEMVSSGVPSIDTLTGGLPRGCLTEICGSASSGRTTLLLSALAAATRREEFCVVIDASDALDPHSAVAAGVELDRLLWVRCGASQNFRNPAKPALAKKFRQKNPSAGDQPGANYPDSGQSDSRQFENCLEQVLRATDLLLESGGFGLVVLDLGDLPQPAARHIPLTTWFRFRRAIEHTSTILLALEQRPIAGSCSSLLLQLGSPNDPILPAEGFAAERGKKICRTEHPGFDFPSPTHAQLLTGLDITAELIRSRLERKPARSTAAFASKTAWAG